jgi:hypothetical protein
MNMNVKVAAAADEDLRLKTLSPGMASALATSPVDLHDEARCYDALVVQYRHDDVLHCLSAAIIQARIIRARAA